MSVFDGNALGIATLQPLFNSGTGLLQWRFFINVAYRIGVYVYNANVYYWGPSNAHAGGTYAIDTSLSDAGMIGVAPNALAIS